MAPPRGNAVEKSSRLLEFIHTCPLKLCGEHYNDVSDDILLFRYMYSLRFLQHLVDTIQTRWAAGAKKNKKINAKSRNMKTLALA